ncbi:L-type lectin family protein [Lacticaseibacillus saniviri]
MKSFSPVIIIAIILIGLGIIPSTAVHAAWMAPLGDGTMYSEPPLLSSTSGIPGYVPYGDYFSPLSGGKSEIIQNPDKTQSVGLVVTKATAQQNGAIWSNNPIFDLNQQHQSVSMDLLIKSTDTVPSADGMAFALAGQRPTRLGASGASLGVWSNTAPAPDFGSGLPLTNQLAKSAVIAFDTFTNADTLDRLVVLNNTDPYAFNLTPKPSYTSTQYLGFGYPDRTDTYFLGSSGSGFGAFKAPYLAFSGDKHNDTFATLPTRPLDTNLQLYSTSDLWHVFEVSWDQNATKTGGTLTYKLDNVGPANANGIKPAITRQVPWSYSDIDSIFGVSSSNRKLYIGFTGSTGTNYEANVLAFRTIPGIVNASGTVTLTKTDSPSTIIDASSILKTNDQLTYHYSVNYDSSSTQSWPSNTSQKLSMVIPKQKYFKALSDQVTLTNSAGTTIGTATLDASDPTQFVINNLPSFPKGTASTIKFNIPIAVDATVDGTLPKGGDPALIRDNTGTVAGDNAQIHVSNTNPNDDDIYTIQYQIQNPGDPYTPPAEPKLNSVPDLNFINTFRFNQTGDQAKANPTVSECIHGVYTHSDEIQPKGATNTTNPPALPYIESVDDVAQALTGTTSDQPQLLSATYAGTPGVPIFPKLSISGAGQNATVNWHLDLKLSPFTSNSHTLPRHAHIAFISEKTTASGSPAAYLPNTTDTARPAVVKDDQTPVTLLNNSTAKALSANSSGDGGFGSGALMGVLYFGQSLPTVQAGAYTSTATWTLSTTPTS